MPKLLLVSSNRNNLKENINSYLINIEIKTSSFYSIFLRIIPDHVHRRAQEQIRFLHLPFVMLQKEFHFGNGGQADLYHHEESKTVGC